MDKKLLKEAFKYAQIETGKETENANAVFLAERITEDYKFSVSSKSMKRYYNGETSPPMEIRKSLAKYLGYKDYRDFIVSNSIEENKNEKAEHALGNGTKNSLENLSITKKSKSILLTLVIAALGISSYFAIVSSSEKCIIWKKDHYEEVECSGARLEKTYNQYLLGNFRRIEVSDTTTFFKHGEPAVWYDKSGNHLEYFTAPGLHPINTKTLKPITNYIIEKHVLNNRETIEVK